MPTPNFADIRRPPILRKPSQPSANLRREAAVASSPGGLGLPINRSAGLAGRVWRAWGARARIAAQCEALYIPKSARHRRLMPMPEQDSAQALANFGCDPLVASRGSDLDERRCRARRLLRPTHVKRWGFRAPAWALRACRLRRNTQGAPAAPMSVQLRAPWGRSEGPMLRSSPIDPRSNTTRAWQRARRRSAMRRQGQKGLRAGGGARAPSCRASPGATGAESRSEGSSIEATLTSPHPLSPCG